MPNQRETTLIELVDAGTMDYVSCWALQERLHADVVAGRSDGHVILVEHPPVLTFGKHGDKAHLLFAADHFKKQGVQLVDTDRGGEVTAHVPGQLVVYPILRLADFKLTPRRYVELLEDTVIEALEIFGIKGTRDGDHPGVWLGKKKICAVGVRIKQRVSLHGIALNVCNSLDLFQQIVPCGIQGRGVTTLAQALGRTVSVADAAPVLVRRLAVGLGDIALESPQGLPGADRVSMLSPTTTR